MKNITKQEKERAAARSNSITIIAQAFYGNRTLTEINRNRIDEFIAGVLSPESFPDEDYHSEDREVVRIPGTDNLVIIYNKFAENERHGKWKPLAVIPELELSIYSRCIVCRMDPDGTLQSLKPEDTRKFMDYLAK